MRPVLVSYFDIGCSYGLGDEVFQPKELNAPPSVQQVGIRNPFGAGIGCDLVNNNKKLLKDWRKCARKLSTQNDSEIDWTEEVGVSEEDFRKTLTRLIEEHSITCCKITIFAVGTALIWLEFDSGIPVEYLNGFSHCFEFAAYTEDISKKLRGVAQRRVDEAIREKGTAIVEISKRPEPRVETDSDGYKELRLFTSLQV